MGLAASVCPQQLHDDLVDAPRRAERDRLIELHLPLVTAIARRYANRGERLDDLVQVGAIGLINAVDRFDPERGIDLRVFAIPTIVGEIKRHLRDRAAVIRVPRRDQEARSELRSARNELAARLQRPPTWSELSAAVSVDLARAVDAERAEAPLSLSVDAYGPETGLDDVGLAAGEDRALVREGLSALDSREQRALVLCYFAGLSHREVAMKLGMSQSHASRVIAGALAKMRAALAGAPKQICGDGTDHLNSERGLEQCHDEAVTAGDPQRTLSQWASAAPHAGVAAQRARRSRGP